jgi:GNAT superfamily N-acetyltransferase
VTSAAPWPLVGPDAVGDIASLCRRAVATPLSPEELRRALFSPDDPAVVRFAPGTGVVATVRHGDEGFVRLLALDPEQRGRGLGHAVLEQAEDDLEGTSVVTVGADPPYFLFPGTPTTETALCALLERHRYQRDEATFNMDVDLSSLPAGPARAELARSGERDAVDAFARTHWPNWHAEVMRAFDQGGLWLAHDGAGISGFCACEVNRGATVGPVASRPDLIGTGASRQLLLAALRALRGRGLTSVEVLWVGPIVPYARVGARVGSAFFVYRRRRPADVGALGDGGGRR